jgi:nitrate reductase gamma subunit
VTHLGDVYVWLVLPYAALAVFAVGHWWRYRYDQFGWTSRSTQLLESRLLAWGSVLFHYGALGVIAGHVLGILVPERATAAIGISEHAYHYLAGIAGSVTGVVCVAARRSVASASRPRRPTCSSSSCSPC